MSKDTGRKTGHDPAPPKENREMYGEIAALVAALAQAFAIKDSDAAAAVESGAMTLGFAEDANGNRYMAAAYQGKEARVYQDAIKHPSQQPT